MPLSAEQVHRARETDTRAVDGEGAESPVKTGKFEEVEILFGIDLKS
ncbi:hypothetical protein IAD21_03724 [Abditibacteriota bacterium]|nr:hypothetical protein IAD21_03724 [Abditibacteriota bacterium]